MPLRLPLLAFDLVHRRFRGEAAAAAGERLGTAFGPAALDGALGEWDAAWDRYAERAVAGRWAESGAETFARRRGGLKPETPVQEVEGKKQGS